MIPIELSWLVFICLLVFLSGIFFVWISYEVVRRQKANRALRNRLRCRVCSMEFADDSPDVLATCPRCGSLNERAKPAFF
ncbi:MAG: hypothetical protein WC076_10210 [Terrimicrobiaceae bacterium]|jgi:cytochrome c-type biogenesis protein CcmH/NrfF|nr:hypothetical protein [Terrimicrobiaceae bacterium]